jgi:hypothetical protein
LYLGPFNLSIPAASSGFLIPFRYFSLSLYCYLVLRQEVNIKHVLYFNVILTISLSSYDSILLFISYVSLVLVELLIDARGYLAWLKRICAPRHILLFSIPLLALAPTVAWYDYAQWLVGLPRAYGRDLIYFLEFNQIATELILPYLLDYGPIQFVYHGTSFLGLFVMPFLVLGLRRGTYRIVAAMRSGRTEDPAGHFSAVFVVWLALIVALSCGAMGLRELVEARESLFGFRNFGFLMPVIILLLALLIANGFADVMAKRASWVDIASDCVIFSLLVAVLYLAQEDKPARPEALIALMLAFVVIAVLSKAMATRFRSVWFAVPIVVAVLLESLSFARLVPSLESVALLNGIEMPGDIIESRMPRFLSDREVLPKTRGFEFPVADHWPFHFEGPAVTHRPSAFTEPLFETPIGTVGLAFTHFFRLPAYHDLVIQSDREDLEAILGVSRPILEIVPQRDIDRGTDDRLRLVTRGTTSDPDGATAVLGDEDVPSARVVSPAGEILDVTYFPSRVTVTLRAGEDTMLIYRDNMAPGWSVRVNGQSAELQVVDQVNKAVALPAGEHRVDFQYRPWAYLVTLGLSVIVLGLGGLACVGLWYGADRRVQAR